MKKINSLLLALLGAFSLTWTACTESVDYLAAGAVEGEGVYFSNSDPTTINLDATEGSFTVNVYRSNTGAATQASVTSEFSEGAASLFTAPASVDFAEGSAVAAFTVAYSGIERGTKYTMTLSIADGTPYGESSQTYTVVFPEDEGNWEVVSKEAVYTDNLFSMYGVSNFKITGVTVEKNADSNQYRFKSPYTNSYFQTVYDMSLFGANFDAPYIILDGEKFKNEAPGKYYIAPTALGFQMVNGEGPKADDSWNTFGSIAGNLSTADGPIPPTSADYPLVSYDETTKKFDFGSVYHNLGGYGYYILEGFTLYLDPDLMTVDYDRDYTWYEVYQGAGTFTTTVVGEPQSWDQAIQRSEEDPTFYRLPSLYTSNNALYFNLDEESGLLVLPKSQKTGLTTNIGSQEIYMSGVPGKCTYDAATKTFNLQLSLHLVDADGNTTAELAQVAETFVWGNGVFKDFATGKKMSDYQGSWNVPFYGMDVLEAIRLGNKRPEPTYLLNLPMFEECDLAALCLGTAMQPDIPPASVLMLKQVSVSALIPGETYAICSARFSGIRIIRQDEDPEKVVLWPRNTQDYDPITIEKAKLGKLFLVRGIIIKKNT